MGVIVVFIVKYEIVGEDSECNDEKNLLLGNVKKWEVHHKIVTVNKWEGQREYLFIIIRTHS